MSISEKRRVADNDEKRKKQKKNLQTVTIAHNSLPHNTTETSKSVSSDKKRLESLKEWKKQLNQQKTTMKKALSTNVSIMYKCKHLELKISSKSLQIALRSLILFYIHNHYIRNYTYFAS